VGGWCYGCTLWGGEGAPSSADDLDMNVAESYGIRWDAEKCGRDAFQNFFDANGGTLDGVTVSTEVEDPKEVRENQRIH